MFAIADSASSFCARVMRGTASIANTVTLRAASRSTSALFCAGQMKLMRIVPGLSRSASCAAVRAARSAGRTLRTMSASA